MKIYVGNLNFRSSEEEIQALFATYGQVEDVTLITDKETGRPRGFGFVIMAADDAGRRAIDELNGKEFDGRALTVNEARPREPRQERSGW
ncbi:MAG: RNA-binding protein [bacterium]|nr:RNA-binding protein [Gemmatimonas sp.]MDO9171541.1 RNA-binding protein [bacterium]